MTYDLDRNMNFYYKVKVKGQDFIMGDLKGK